MFKKIDQFITLPIQKQIGYLLLILIGIGIVFLIIGESLENNPYKTDMDTITEKIEKTDNQSAVYTEQKNEHIWYIVSRLLDPGYLGESNHKWFSFLITIVGWLFCTILLIAIVTNAYNDRIDKVNSGNIRYRFKGHCIIFGSNEMSVSLIKEIRSNKHIENKSAIIVYSQQDIKKLWAYLKDHLSKKEQKFLYIFRGEQESKEQLETLHLGKANMVIVLGEQNEMGVDSSNIECINLISEIKSKFMKKKKKYNYRLPCYLFLKEQPIFKLLQQQDMEVEMRKSIDLHTFNLYENWARMVLSDEKFTDERDYSHMFDKVCFNKSKKDLRFIILGFNRMGKALAIQTARVAHFGNEQKIIITVIDKNANELCDAFLSQYPGIKSMKDIEFEFKQYSIDSKQTKRYITSWAQNDEIMAISVCFRNSDTSLYVGLNFPYTVYEKRIPVLIRQENLHGFASSINSLSKFDKVRFFGMLENTFSLNFDRDRYAKIIHNDYLKLLESNNSRDYVNPSHQDWIDLPEQYRWSNRYLVDIYPVKIRMLEKTSMIFTKINVVKYLKLLNEVMTIFYEPVSKNQEKRNVLWSSLSMEKQEIAKDIERMALIEHNRWIAEKILAGWEYSPNRDNNRLLHNDIMTFEELTEEKKMHDRKPSVKMIELYLNHQEK